MAEATALRWSAGTPGGLPAVATAYLREEIDPRWATAATGLYIGGTAIGGMSGRLLTGLLAQDFGWQAALAGIGVMALLIAVTLGVLLEVQQQGPGRPPVSLRFAFGRGLG